MARLRYNGLTGTLGAAHNDSTTTLTLASKLTHEGGDVPTISGDYIPLSILDSNGNCAEIVHVTAYTSAATSATVTRGAEGTTASAHDNGATFVNGPTVKDIGLTRVGKMTQGASSEGPAGGMVKSVTLSEGDVVLSVTAMLKPVSGAAVSALGAGAWQDTGSNAPGLLAGAMTTPTNQVYFGGGTGAARWVSVPLGFVAPADGTYWCGLAVIDAGSVEIYYDTSGSDYTTGGAFPSNYIRDESITWSNSTKDYSIYLTVLTA